MSEPYYSTAPEEIKAEKRFKDFLQNGSPEEVEAVGNYINTVRTYMPNNSSTDSELFAFYTQVKEEKSQHSIKVLDGHYEVIPARNEDPRDPFSTAYEGNYPKFSIEGEVIEGEVIAETDSNTGVTIPDGEINMNTGSNTNSPLSDLAEQGLKGLKKEIESQKTETPKTEGAMRFDKGKPQLELISPIAMIGLAKILTFGARKYSSHNWRKGMAWSRCIGSLKRHLAAFEAGVDRDYDENCEGCINKNCLNHTGELHIDQIMCNAMFLSEYSHTHPELDDRYKVDPKFLK